MSPAAQKIINDLHAHMEAAFEQLVDLVQEEAVNEMISKLSPTTAKARLIKERPLIVVAPIQEDDDASFQRSGFLNPEDDPNYGAVGSGCYSTGKMGAVVTEVTDDDE